LVTLEEEEQDKLLSADVGIGGAPPNGQTAALSAPTLSADTLLTRKPRSHWTRIGTLRSWVDATDSLFEGGDPEVGRCDSEEYFAVSLSGDTGKDSSESSINSKQAGESAHVPQYQSPSGSEEQEIEIPDRVTGTQAPPNQILASPIEEDLVGRNMGGSSVPEAAAVQDTQQGTEAGDLACMKAFCASIIKTLAPPLLREVESMRTLSADAEPFTPKRVTRRSAATSVGVATKQAKKASAAESVLLKALGITPADLSVTEGDLQRFKRMFDVPLREQHLRVVAAIFGKSMPESCQALVDDTAVLVQ
jgi:hypothetical protein